MRERIFILVSIVVIVAALVALNAASYVRLEQEADSEAFPNRSTFNAGATGTRAFYDFLRETGKNVTRWQEKPSALLNKYGRQVDSFIVIGRTRRRFDDDEIRDLLAWTERGGRLILIDRSPNSELLKTDNGWRISTVAAPLNLESNPENTAEMTRNVIAAKSTQPTLLTAEVGSVMPSRFAALIKLDPVNSGVSTIISSPNASPTPAKNPVSDEDDEYYEDEPPPAPKPTPKTGTGFGGGSSNTSAPTTVNPAQKKSAPVVHLASGETPLLVDYPYGAGRVVFLSDPFVVSNGGIELVDNLRLATNIVGGGQIAFDEYHQGYGSSGNPILNYFAGTPIPAIAAQLALLALAAIWTRGRRFARPLPLPNPDRRSKLEYVSAMAELLHRARTYDLAVENIYNRVRRSLTRYAGVDNSTTSNEELAARIAERSKINQRELADLLRECENAIQGERISDKKALALAGRLREIERQLGLTKRVANSRL